jgi:hypothetical protein
MKPRFSSFILSTLILLQLVIMAGCSPYNKLDTRDPKTVKDSFQLALRCSLAFPIDTTTVPGTVFRDTIIRVDTTILRYWDTVTLTPSMNMDSLRKALKAQCVPKEIHIKDSCTPKVITVVDHKEVDKWRFSYILKDSMHKKLTTAYHKLELKEARKTKYMWGFWFLLALIAGVAGTYTYMKFKSPVKLS